MSGMHAPHGGPPASQIWLTPPHIIEALGPFDLDPCAAPAPRPYPTARNHYTHTEGDGLRRRWDGRVWCNPPYARNIVGRWLLRLAGHGRGTALVFARTSTDFFFRSVWEQATAALFLRGYLRFLHPDGTEAEHDAGAPSVLVAYGAEDAEILRYCGLDGRFNPISPAAIIWVAQQLLAETPLPAEDVPVEMTWREILQAVLDRAGRAMSLPEIYGLMRNHPKGAFNANWEAKIRQTLNSGGFRRVAPGQYELAV